MEVFEEILIKYNCPKRLEKPSSTIEEIENIIKFKLPLDYKTYLLNYLGFGDSFGDHYVRLWDFDEIIEQNRGYSICDNLPNTLAIGSNGAGEFIGLELMDDGIYRIILSPFIDLDKEFHIEIGTSFTDFLIRLDNGQNWFDE